MAAIGCRIAKIGPKPVTSIGSVLNKRTASIQEMCQSTQEMRILEDTTFAPNSVNFPTIEDYILLEAANGYKVAVINQSWVITYNA